MLSDMFDQDAAFDAYIEAVKRELKDEHQKETKELKEELQKETKELKDELQRQNKKNREESIKRHISFCIKHKLSQEEIIQSLVDDFELSREESSKRVLEFVKSK